MRVALTAIGSRGDVQPLIALGAGLRARGHEVRIAAPDGFQKLAGEAGLEYRTIPGDPDGFFRTPGVIESLRKSPSMIRAGRALPKVPVEAMCTLIQMIQDETSGVDLVLNSVLTRAVEVAEPLTPWCATSWWPTTPTSAFPALGWPELSLGAPYNRFTHFIARHTEWWLSRRYVNGFRTGKGLPPFGVASPPLRALGHSVPIVYPFSPSLVPKPADWPARAHVTGYWFWDRTWQPPAELVSFLADGPAPLALTFGSTWAVHRPEETVRHALGAARAVGRRIVMIDGPTDGLPGDVLRVHDVDYGWLFPRTCAVIHHGGFGTTAAAVRAGVPQVLVPTYADHPFWTARLTRAGVATAVPFPKLTGEGLAAAVAGAVGDPGVRERAEALGALVDAERGVDNACEVLESWVAEKAGVAPTR